MLIKQLSFRNRLLLTATLVLVAFLGLSAFSLNNAFKTSADKAQYQRLQNYVYSILSLIEFHNSGLVKMPSRLPEPEFSIPNSGLYAQISRDQHIFWQSPSALGRSLNLPLKTEGSLTEQVSVVTIKDEGDFITMTYDIVWENDFEQNFNFTLNIAEALSSIKQEKMGFQRSLWYWLGGTGLMLLIAQALILRWSLRPLNDVADDLNAIKSGDKKRLSKDYPAELNQLTQNINILLDHEYSRRERYKNSLADLAHSLKTPLAVLRGEFDSNTQISELRTTANEQLNRISDLVDYQLQRASTEGQSSLQAPVSLGDMISKILKSLDKVYLAKKIHHQFEIQQDIFVHADEGDMYELLGNLLDNAYKYCNKQVNILVHWQSSLLEIIIDDDGSGVPEREKHTIIKRGKRIDTEVEGHGLGLAIASDIVNAYQGSINLTESPIGGARFIIQLPKS
ncbi:MAG: histidine kinase [Methylophaga sp.]|nr:MAG: histidine kinase [Methylophaga sp.]